jgi:hypothetical protein
VRLFLALLALLILAAFGIAWQWRSDWPIRYRVWRWLHGLANDAVWRWARPAGPSWGIALRIDHRHPLWRLNGWLAGRWTGWWVARTSSEPSDERALIESYRGRMPPAVFDVFRRFAGVVGPDGLRWDPRDPCRESDWLPSTYREPSLDSLRERGAL